MRAIFWAPSESYKLIKLVWHFDDRPIIKMEGAAEDEEDLAGQAEWLVEQGDTTLGEQFFSEWVQGNFEPSYRPSFVRQRIFKDGMDTKEEVVQPLDRKSILFFLANWETGPNPIIFSGDSDLNVIATKLAAYYYNYPNREFPPYIHLPDYPVPLDVDFAKCSRYVIYTHALIGVSGMLIVSRDNALLQSMFDYLVSIGERGFVCDGSSEFQKKRKQMGEKLGGLYLDDVPAGLAWWNTYQMYADAPSAP